MLEKEIAAASAVVVLWWPRSVISDWVRTEAHYGQDRAKLVPVMVEACSVPIAFLLKQTVNLCDWRGERDHRQWRKLLTWVADLAATKPGSSHLASASSWPNRFAMAIRTAGIRRSDRRGAFVNVSTPGRYGVPRRRTNPVMRILPKGAFLLGSPATDPITPVEGPQKRIEIPTPFAMGVFPVLIAEYQSLMGVPPSVATTPAPARGLLGVLRPRPVQVSTTIVSNPLLPVTHVSFDEAQTFVARLAASTGDAYRIPSEAEWEYACRAGSRGRYCFGDIIDATKAAFAAAAGPVLPGSFPPNAFGLYDMHGNVREWTRIFA
jgi:formylglycine-generating enzyme required for sulfatase activity